MGEIFPAVLADREPGVFQPDVADPVLRCGTDERIAAGEA